jgi:hypothetical protein
MWTRDLGTFNIDFETQGDEFIHHIEQHVGLMPMRGSNGRSPAGPATKLELHLQDDGVPCFVVGNDDVDETADQVNPWRDAASAAAKATGHTAITFAWQAVIGTAAVEAGQDRLGPLEREGAIGQARAELPHRAHHRPCSTSYISRWDCRGIAGL